MCLKAALNAVLRFLESGLRRQWKPCLSVKYSAFDQRSCAAVNWANHGTCGRLRGHLNVATSWLTWHALYCCYGPHMMTHSGKQHRRYLARASIWWIATKMLKVKVKICTDSWPPVEAFWWEKVKAP